LSIKPPIALQHYAQIDGKNCVEKILFNVSNTQFISSLPPIDQGSIIFGLGTPFESPTPSIVEAYYSHNHSLPNSGQEYKKSSFFASAGAIIMAPLIDLVS